MRRQVEPFAPFGLLFVFALLMVPGVNREFFQAIYSILDALGVDALHRYCGENLYRFWEGTSEYCAVSP